MTLQAHARLSLLPVSTQMTGHHGVTDMCLSLACIVGTNGVEDILTLNLSSEEELSFRTSADKLKSTLKDIRQH